MISALITLVIVGFVCWLLITLIPMPEPFPRLVIAVGCIFALIVILNALGVLHGGVALH